MACPIPIKSSVYGNWNNWDGPMHKLLPQLMMRPKIIKVRFLIGILANERVSEKNKFEIAPIWKNMAASF